MNKTEYSRTILSQILFLTVILIHHPPVNDRTAIILINFLERNPSFFKNFVINCDPEPIQMSETFDFNTPPTDSMFVKLKSSDDHEFIVKRKFVIQSSVFKNLLCGSAPGNIGDEVHFTEYSSLIMRHVCLYLAYKMVSLYSKEPIPEFPIAPEIAMDLLMAANFLDI